MFIEEAEWLQQALANVHSFTGSNLVANLGSSTQNFREKIQPHINEKLIKPLLKKDWKVIHVDLKQEEGVDIIGNITETAFGEEQQNKFALTLCTNMLEHVSNIQLVIDNILQITKINGFIAITVPKKYKLHFDPIDNGFRPLPSQIFKLFPENTVKVINSAVIKIQNKKYYAIKKSHFPFWNYREKFKYFLGYRYQVSAVILQVMKKIYV